jgi:murein DD-endopeptidase MepM/ murein hydrolase activator NlpD
MGPAPMRHGDTAVSSHVLTKDRCMDPQRLARLSDRRAVFLADGSLIGGTAARSARGSRTTVGPRGVLITRTPGAELAAELVGLDLPAIELPAPSSAVSVAAGDATVAEGEAAAAAGDASSDQVVADLSARSGARSRPSGRRRPAFVLAAALMGVVSLGGLLTSGELLAHAAAPVDEEPTSVAEELGLLRAQESALTGDEAADRLQEMGASRALREDAQAAAAQAQAATEQAARDAAAAAAAAEAAEAARPDVVVPVAGARLTSGFGARWGTVHAGIDLAAPMQTPEYAAMDGVVLKAGAASGYGLAVYLQHPNGDVTVYGHMDSILVQEGQSVRAGDTIALLGNRGQSTGPHLHFEVRVGSMDGTPVDPVGWLRERGVGI